MMNRGLFVAFLLAVGAASALATDVGRVKIIHTYPSAPAIDIYILRDGFEVKSFMNLPYKGATGWFSIGSPVTYSIRITLAGSSDPIFTSDISFTPYSTVAIFRDNGGGYLGFGALNDDLTKIPTDKARITTAHYALGYGRLDFGIGNETTKLGSDFVYTAFPIPPYDVDPGNVTIDVRPAGNTSDPLVSLNMTLEAQKHYLIVAFGENSVQDLVAYELADRSINARVAFVHGIPGNVSVNVIAGRVGSPPLSLTLFHNVQYKGITEYKNIAVGTYQVTVKVGDNTIILLTAFFNGFTEATLYATTGTDGPVGILLYDDNTAPADGKTNVRVLHGAGAAPRVDVLSGTDVIVSNISYGLDSAYLALSAGSYSLSVNTAGTSTSVFTMNLNLAAGRIITVLAAGNPSGTGTEAFTLIVVTDATYGADGNLRIVHAVAGGPNVNIKANGNQILANVAYKGVSAYLPVPAGLYKVSVHAASNNSELFHSPVRVDAAGYFTAVAGSSNGNYALFQLRDDASIPASGNAHLRVVHSFSASPALQEVNIEFADSIVGSIIYSDAFGYVPTPGGSYAARVITAINNATVFNGSLTLDADTVVSVFAVGILNDETNGFTVVPTIDFDYRTPPAAPVASTPSKAPSRNPATSSASYIAVSSVVLMALATLI